MNMKKNIVAVLSFVACSLAYAHPMLVTKTGTAGQYTQVVISNLSHGCSGGDVTAFKIMSPAPGVKMFPNQIPGFEINQIWKPLPEKFVRKDSHDGSLIDKEPESIEWVGRVKPSLAQAYSLGLRLPDTPGDIYFKVIITCENGKTQNFVVTPDSSEEVKNTKGNYTALKYTVH
jgi:uncharacterized protein YcnI